MSVELENEINTFFISFFYSVLSIEERSLEAISNGKLSMKEIHLIEAVFKTKPNGENNFSNIAKLLNVTLGTLTTSFSKLEKKGYLVKEQDKKDRRIYYIQPTRLAELINEEHSKFHEKLAKGIVTALNDEQDQKQMITALKKLSDFFGGFKQM